MRFSPLLTLLPALAVAQEQVPLMDRVQGWFNKAKAMVPTPQFPDVPAAVEQKVAATVAAQNIQPFSLTNWQSLLQPSTDAQDWLVFITGGNQTCFGRCEQAEKSFNESTVLFAADPTAPRLGYLNCETETILCSGWSAGTPSVYYFEMPKVAATSEERPATPLHVVELNATTVTPQTIYKIHSEKTYKESPAYEGMLHPTDGFVAKYGLVTPLGYFIYGLSVVPSWAVVLVISFFSRTVMSRRMAHVGTRPVAGRD